jgi:CYTH domain-containing protein
MATEIERKFLVVGDAWRREAQGFFVRQGFLSTTPGRTVRVRAVGEKAYLTIKGMRTGISRAEFEYEIPLADAEYMLDQLCPKPLIEKTRHRVRHAGLTWEVDEFSGANAGLVIAEVELESESQPVDLPEWAGQDVSTDFRYTNSYLSQHPFTTWSERP